MTGDDDYYDASPGSNGSEPRWWGLFLFVLLVGVLFYAICGDYGDRPETKSDKTGVQAVSSR